MSDLFLGQTRSAGFRIISAGAAYTLTLPWQADKMVVNNLTRWTATAGGDPVSVWFRDQTTAAYAYQQTVIDSSAGASFNFKQATTNGFTVADTTLGVATSHKLIAGVSQANPCVVTTTAAHGYITNQIVRISDLGSDMPTARGMEQINNLRFKIVVIDSTSFSLKDVVSGEAINSTSYTAWVAGGRVTLESHSLTLNNPQQSPQDVTPYVSTGFSYDPVTYKMTLGTDIMQTDNDVLFVEAYGFGSYTNIGDVA
jgi:hypothetical protein